MRHDLALFLMEYIICTGEIKLSEEFGCSGWYTVLEVVDTPQEVRWRTEERGPYARIFKEHPRVFDITEEVKAGCINLIPINNRIFTQYACRGVITMKGFERIREIFKIYCSASDKLKIISVLDGLDLVDLFSQLKTSRLGRLFRKKVEFAYVAHLMQDPEKGIFIFGKEGRKKNET